MPRNHLGRAQNRSWDRPTLAQLGKELHEAHNGQLDHTTDLGLARQGADVILEGTAVDLDADYAYFVLVCEVLWNRDHADEAVTLCHAWCELVNAAKQTADLDGFQSKARDVRALRQLGRAMHRAHDPGAWQVITAAHRILCEEAGGRKQLSRLMITSPFEGLGDLYSELLGIAVPAARRRPASEHAMAELFVGDAIAAARQIPLGSREHCKYHALVAMTLQYICAQGNRQRDHALVDLLWQLDHTTRPRHARGQITRWVIWASVAAYFGETAKARIYRRKADQELARVEMNRHRRVLNSHYPAS
jgi:hypothetical protein